jgi:hypothetical protein
MDGSGCVRMIMMMVMVMLAMMIIKRVNVNECG